MNQPEISRTHFVQLITAGRTKKTSRCCRSETRRFQTAFVVLLSLQSLNWITMFGQCNGDIFLHQMEDFATVESNW